MCKTRKSLERRGLAELLLGSWQALFHRSRAGDPQAPVIDGREVVRIARSLPVASPFNLEDLMSNVSGMIGVPVELAPYPAQTIADARRLGEALPAALCVATPTRVHVLYRTDTTPSHQRHSILHEVGHLLCRHVTPETTGGSRAMRRGTYDDAQEQAAEMFAYEFERRLGSLRLQHGEPRGDERLTYAIERYGLIFEG
ncbi:ImmA/IrrE family metallo-endopeptidase [Saccharothrix saharensis]|uniref:ImmA/IrrE family metallo-endopeptidase n=1 Tax=Saccharothrix saharensis TaxID=571190 RepID=UPI0036C4BBEC